MGGQSQKLVAGAEQCGSRVRVKGQTAHFFFLASLPLAAAGAGAGSAAFCTPSALAIITNEMPPTCRADRFAAGGVGGACLGQHADGPLWDASKPLPAGWFYGGQQPLMDCSTLTMLFAPRMTEVRRRNTPDGTIGCSTCRQANQWRGRAGRDRSEGQVLSGTASLSAAPGCRACSPFPATPRLPSPPRLTMSRPLSTW